MLEALTQLILTGLFSILGEKPCFFADLVPCGGCGAGCCGLQSVLCHTPPLLPAFHCICRPNGLLEPLYLVDQLPYLWQHFGDTLNGIVWVISVSSTLLCFAIFYTRNVWRCLMFLFPFLFNRLQSFFFSLFLFLFNRLQSFFFFNIFMAISLRSEE